MNGLSALPRPQDRAEMAAMSRGLDRQAGAGETFDFPGQFRGTPLPGDVRDWRERGLQIGPAIGQGTYQMAVARRRAQTVMDINTLRWIGPVPDAMKSAGVLRDGKTPVTPHIHQLRDGGAVRYGVMFHALATSADIAALLARLDATVANPDDPAGALRLVDLPFDQVGALGASGLVIRILPGPGPSVPNNTTTRTTIGAQTLEQVAGLTGVGITIGIWEADEDDFG